MLTDSALPVTPFETKPTLVGERVTLRPIQAGAADVLRDLLREDAEAARLTGSIRRTGDDPFADVTLEAMRAVYENWSSASDRLVLAVIDNASGARVREVVLNDWSPDDESCGLRTVIGQAGRGRGPGSEAAALVINHGLRTMGLHRISLEVYDFNPRARHVYEKVGFVHGGTSREALRFDDEWIDMHYMAIVAQG